MSQKFENLQKALQRIDELEIENNLLKERIAELEKIVPAGRRTHDEKWQAKYDVFVELYESGKKIPAIVETTGISRRTIYRYKEYYDSMQNKK